VSYAEHTEHSFNATSTSEYQTFNNTQGLSYRSNVAEAVIGHVRVQVVDDRRRPISFPAELDCALV
jgi:hypothetical protein